MSRPILHTSKQRWAVGATGLGMTVLGVFLVQSKWLGTQAVPADYYPEGFAGVSVANEGDVTHAILETRADGTPVFTADPIRFTDRAEGELIIERPAVSLAEADRLGHDESRRSLLAYRTYLMRGPISAGFTDTDAQWLLEVHRRHESAEFRAFAVGFIALALLNNHRYDADSWSSETERQLLNTFEAGLNASDQAVQAAALRQADWDGWAAKSPTFVDSIRQAAAGEGDNAETARLLLAHVFAEGE